MTLSLREARHILAGIRLPAALVDLDAFDRNLDRLTALTTAHGLTVRLATKSLRVPRLITRALERGGAALRGLMTYDIGECEHLALHGFDDLLLAYPIAREADLRRAASLVRKGTTLRITMDDASTAARAGHIARDEGVVLPVVVCVDMSLRALGGRVHLGVRRSPLHTPVDVVTIAHRIAATPGLSFDGVLGYEAQVAGLGDDSPYHRRENVLRSAVRRISSKELAHRRRTMVQALASEGLVPRIVNGGGTGSLDSTTPDSGVNEVTFGSGLYKPHLFDYYRSTYMRALEPAAFFALEVTRRPAPGIVTCLGGGYIASGAAGPDRLPRPVIPPGLTLLATEGAGEVQTPLRGAAADGLELGDPILFRHAKAGELMERFAEVLLVSNGNIVERVPTYRGTGLTTL